MMILKNKIFIVAVCLVSFVLSGLIVTDRVFGVGLGTPLDMGGRDISNIAGLNATGDVKGGRLCIGAVCKAAWPEAGVATCDVCDSRFVNQWESWASNLTVTGRADVSSAGGSGGYISSGNYGGTGSAAYFPSGLWSNGSTAWIYGTIYVNGAIYDTANRWSINPAGNSWFNGGNMGIGTASPAVKLDVVQNAALKVGNAYLSSGGDFAHLANNEWYNGSAWQATAAGALIQLSGQDTNFYRHDVAGVHTFSMKIDASGNVGIGTASPEGKLHISGGNLVMDNTRTLQAKNVAGTIETWMWPRWSDNVMYTNFGSGGWNIRNNASASRVFIQDGGNVGIGTTNPASKLVVYDGGESITQPTFTQALANAGIQISTDYTADAFTPGIFWQTLNNNSTRPKAGIYLRETGSGTYMFLGTSNNYSTGITNNAVVIDYSGKVGIGLMGPTQRLDVDGYVKGTGLCIAADCRTAWPAGGDITAVGSMTSGDVFAGSTADDDWLGLGSAAGRIEFDDQTTDEVNILGANVGIGTASPNQKLSVSGNVLIGNADGELGYYLGFRGRSDMGVRSNGYSVSVEAPDYISVNIDSNNNNTNRYFSVRTNGSDYSGGSELFRVQENGNIGIGDTSPAALFTVGSGDLFQVNSSGNLVKINNVTYSWPSSQGAASTYLKNNGSGTLTWETISTGDNLGNHTATQNLNMSGYQIQNFRIENRTTDPASPAVGQMWICTDAGNSTPCDGI